MNLSPTQIKALTFAHENHEGRLHRWPGGYWSDDPWDGDRGTQPRRWVGTHTVEALRTRGMVSIVEGSRLHRGDPTIVEITSKGLAELKTRVGNDSLAT